MGPDWVGRIDRSDSSNRYCPPRLDHRNCSTTEAIGLARTDRWICRHWNFNCAGVDFNLGRILESSRVWHADPVDWIAPLVDWFSLFTAVQAFSFTDNGSGPADDLRWRPAIAGRFCPSRTSRVQYQSGNVAINWRIRLPGSDRGNHRIYLLFLSSTALRADKGRNLRLREPDRGGDPWYIVRRRASYFKNDGGGLVDHRVGRHCHYRSTIEPEIQFSRRCRSRLALRRGEAWHCAGILSNILRCPRHRSGKQSKLS